MAAAFHGRTFTIKTPSSDPALMIALACFDAHEHASSGTCVDCVSMGPRRVVDESVVKIGSRGWADLA